MLEFKGLGLHVSEPTTSDSDSKSGLIVIQEWWGLNAHMKAMTDRFASSLGCIAVCPDLYHGKSTTAPDEAHHLMSNLDWPGAIEEIRTTCAYLMERGCSKIGVVGFCMGGALALASAVKLDCLDACVVFYGIPPRELADPATILVPTQFHFSDKDTMKGFSDPDVPCFYLGVRRTD